jgi:hypothetical protein
VHSKLIASREFNNYFLSEDIMIARLLSATCLAAVFSSVAMAAECQPEGAYEQFAFQPPPGFVELRARSAQNGITYTFREDKLESESAAIIQLSFNYTKDDFSLLKPEHQDEAKELYITRYIGGIESRRAEFKKSAVLSESVGNSAYKKIAWSGKTGNEQFKGAMYVTIINNVVTVVNLQLPEPVDGALEKSINDCLGTLNLTLD